MAKKSDYSKKLANPLWQRKRLELMNLRGFKCETCGNDKEELHVHHKFYINGRQAWQYDNDVFQVLCNTCHKKEHGIKDGVTKKVSTPKVKRKQKYTERYERIEDYKPEERPLDIGYILDIKDFVTACELLEKHLPKIHNYVKTPSININRF